MTAELTSTIKFGKGYDAPWVVARGESVKESKEFLEEAFGIEPNPDATLAEVVMQAKDIACGMANVSEGFKGKPIKSEKTEPAKKAEPEPDKPEGPTVYDKIEAAEDRSRMDEIWAEHRREFKDPDLKAAWVKKAKALKEAAAA